MIATKTCECGQEIEFIAEEAGGARCPYCAALIQERATTPPAETPLSHGPPKSPRDMPAVILILIAMALGAAAIGSMVSATAARAKKKEVDAEFYRVLTNAVSANLRAPATARFCPPEELAISYGYSGRKAQGWVDAQNGFGALIRSEFTVEFSAKVQPEVRSVDVQSR